LAYNNHIARVCVSGPGPPSIIPGPTLRGYLDDTGALQALPPSKLEISAKLKPEQIKLKQYEAVEAEADKSECSGQL